MDGMSPTYMAVRRFVFRRFPPKLTHAIDMLKNVIVAHVEPEIALVPLLTDRRKVGVDVGAHMGLFAHLMAQSSQHVYAFEPQRELYDYLVRLDLGNVTLHNFALSNVAGHADLRVPTEKRSGAALEAYGRISPHNSFGSIEVTGTSVERIETRRLDDFAWSGRVGLIKIDVEGHELSVLEGATRTLDDDRPNLIVEIAREANPGYIEVFRFLTQKGYRSYVCSRSGRTLDECLEVFDFERPENQSRISRNFVFVPQ
jgi:FkbM family methyltransferase